jgi:O-antigen ligase
MLGYGYKGFWTGLKGASLNVVLTSGWVLAQAQNGVLDTWVQMGIPGVAVFTVMVLQAVRNGIRCFRGTGQNTYVRWCIVIILCGLGYNVGESSLGIVSLVWFFFLLACIGLNETAHAAYPVVPRFALKDEGPPVRSAQGLLTTGDRRFYARESWMGPHSEVG